MQLHSVFPKTIEILQEKRISYLKEQFGKTLKEELLLAAAYDQSRWFPVFLKFQGVRPEILEVAEFEYLRHSAKDSHQGLTKSEIGEVKLNSSLQFAELHFDQPRLGRTRGLYCFFKNSKGFFEFQMGILQALIVDLLHEERKYSLDQLADVASQHKMGSSQGKEEWVQIIHEMVQLGILFRRTE